MNPYTYTLTFTVKSKVALEPKEVHDFVCDINKVNPIKFFAPDGTCNAELYSEEITQVHPNVKQRILGMIQEHELKHGEMPKTLFITQLTEMEIMGLPVQQLGQRLTDQFFCEGIPEDWELFGMKVVRFANEDRVE